ncbi:hypothetical protein BD779DRAFT_1679595 [Infundibulicybe gibba]|nr:hypothetical protein BD779DRAFT_1679595 [Infundibulicybe gibba]
MSLALITLAVKFNHSKRTWLVLWEAEVAIQLPPWVVCLYPSSLLTHFNIDVHDIKFVTTDGEERPTPANSTPLVEGDDEGRGSFVYFNQAALYQSSETGFPTLKKARLAGKATTISGAQTVEAAFPPSDCLPDSTSSANPDAPLPSKRSVAAPTANGCKQLFFTRNAPRHRRLCPDLWTNSNPQAIALRIQRRKLVQPVVVLLGALSDSQHTTRVLCEENATVRSQLDTVERDNMGLKWELGELKGLVRDLEDRELEESDMPAVLEQGSGNKNEMGRLGGIHMHTTYRGSGSVGATTNCGMPLLLAPARCYISYPAKCISPSYWTTWTFTLHTRTRMSLFPVPPANMTMLFHNNAKDFAASTPTKLQHIYHPDQQQPPGTQKRCPHQQPPSSLGRPIPGAAQTRVTSTDTGLSISPTTVDFSMTTSSPGSLLLRPERKVLLGNMESLHLGQRMQLEEDVYRKEEGWDL